MELMIDEETNTLRIRITDAPIEESDEVLPGLIWDYDADGKLAGMEFLDASDVFGDLKGVANGRRNTFNRWSKRTPAGRSALAMLIESSVTAK